MAEQGTTATAQVDRRFHGRRKGRRLRAGMEKLLRDRLPELMVTPPPESDQTVVMPADLFGRSFDAYWLEIGFGAGEHLAWQAENHPETGIIGGEPFLNGVASLLRHLDDAGIGDNVRILPDDIRPLLECLAPGSLDRIFVLFPDPWPKARHAERRIVQYASIARFHDLLRPGGELRMATDDMNYARWMLQRASAHPGLRWLARGPRDWRERPTDWPGTRYEAKAIRQGRRPAFLRFQRID